MGDNIDTSVEKRPAKPKSSKLIFFLGSSLTIISGFDQALTVSFLLAVCAVKADRTCDVTIVSSRPDTCVYNRGAVASKGSSCSYDNLALSSQFV